MENSPQALEMYCQEILGYIGEGRGGLTGTLQDCCDTLEFISQPNYGYQCTEPQRIREIRQSAGDVSTQVRSILNTLKYDFTELLEAIRKQITINHESSQYPNVLEPQGLNTSGDHEMSKNSNGQLNSYRQEIERQAARLRIQKDNAVVCIEQIKTRMERMEDITSALGYDIAQYQTKCQSEYSKLAVYVDKFTGEESLYGKIAVQLEEWVQETNDVTWDQQTNSYLV